MKVLGTILRFLFSWLDSVVANLITTVYDLLLNLSNLILYSDNIVKTLGKRIGLILGIFMLFRIAITLVNYLISPDQVKDSSKGFKKLFANIFISLFLLATVNHIFDFAYKLQLEVVNSNIIGKIFFGSKNSVSLKADGTEVIGPDADIGYYLYSAFFTPNPDVGNLKRCSDMWDVEVNVKENGCDSALSSVLSGTAKGKIWKARSEQNLSNVFSDWDIVLAKSDGDFVFNYLPIISTAAGVIVVLIMISFCMDLALRAVKLLFLQIIAPIPIIANMDPSKGKDMFGKWYKECFKTYLSVFLRLIAINFAIFMITLIYGNFKGMFSGNVLINAFIIIGCLMFAKQAPKLLEDMFGIKSDGMLLHPLKKFQEQALFGKNITGLAAAGLAGTAAVGANMAARFRMGTKETGFEGHWDRTVGTILSGVAGGLSAAARGTVGAIKGDKFSQVYGNAYRGAVRARNNRNSRIDSHIWAPEVWLDNLSHKAGIETEFEYLENQVKLYDEASSASEAAVSLSESELDKFADKINFGHNEIKRITGITDGKIEVRDLNNNDVKLYTLAELREAMNDNTKFDARTRAILNAKYNQMRGDIAEDIRTKIYNNRASTAIEYSFVENGQRKYLFSDTNVSANTIKNHMKNVDDIRNEHKSDPIFSKFTSIDGKTIKDIAKQTASASKTTKASDPYKRAQKIHEQAQREKK